MRFGPAGAVMLGVVMAAGFLGVACGSSGRGAQALCDPFKHPGTCRDTPRQAIYDYGLDSGTSAGSLVAKRGPVATLRVVTIRSRPDPTTPAARHVPVAGKPIAVHYE